MPDFRFQGSWYDSTTGLSWAVKRWYSPSLGRFISEDALLGEPSDPPSRHLYAYGQGQPVSRWDPDGRRSLWLDYASTWNEIATWYYGSDDFARDLAVRNNWFGSRNELMKTHKAYFLPEYLKRWDGRLQHYTVYRRDDPIGRVDGYSFGRPLVKDQGGDPWIWGAKAWRPAILSPVVCSTTCFTNPPGTYVPTPAGAGRWIESLGWAKGGTYFGGSSLGEGYGGTTMTASLRALRQEYEHGSFVSEWLNYDMNNFRLLCLSWSELCVSNLVGTFRVTAGNAANSVGSSVTSFRGIWRLSDGPWTQSLSFTRRDNRFFNVWVPRAWGPVKAFSFSGGFFIDGPNSVGMSMSIPATRASAIYWSWPPGA